MHRLWRKVTDAIKQKDQETATNEKMLIEDQQRENAKERQKQETSFQPRFFELNNTTKEYVLKNNGYVNQLLCLTVVKAIMLKGSLTSFNSTYYICYFIIKKNRGTITSSSPPTIKKLDAFIFGTSSVQDGNPSSMNNTCTTTTTATVMNGTTNTSNDKSLLAT